MPKMGKYESFFGPKSTVLSFSPITFIRFFWNCTWWQAWKNGLKWSFLFFNKNLFGPIWLLLNFHRNLFFRFVLKLYLMAGIKKWVIVTVLDFKGKFKFGANAYTVRTEGSIVTTYLLGPAISCKRRLFLSDSFWKIQSFGFQCHFKWLLWDLVFFCFFL